MGSRYVEDEETLEIRKLEVQLAEDTDEFEVWEKLVQTAEQLEGGLNRNSSPQSISTVRDIYDRFLAKFPLFFGYWKKYADLEFSIAGTEAAELVYERGISSISSSVDLWTNYCTFKVETSHDPEVIRELFERGAACVGLDFLSHIFWDKYLEFEERLELRDQIFAILKRIILIPMHQYARYFERYRSMAASRPIVELAEPEILQGFQIAMETESADAALAAGLQYIPRSELDAETEIRLRIDAYNLEIFGRTQMETTKRWTYEQEIKRPYFHVKDLDETELINWRKYLAFEESEGDYARVCFLYERCLVTCAFYDEFWFRYIRFMSAQEEQAAKQMQQLQQLTAPAGAPGAAPPPAPVPPKKTEEIRNIYLRAACFFVPIALPQIRLNFAYFEEVHGRPEVAAAIHQAILLALPHHLPSIISWAHLVRRTHGLDPAVAVLQSFLDPAPADPTGAAETPTPVPAPVRAALTTEWALMLWRAEGQVDEARRVFLKGKETDCCRESAVFWDGYLTFELEMGGCGGGGGSAGGRPQEAQIRQEAVLRAVVEGIRKSSVEGPVREGLLRRWMGYLMERGRGAGCMAEWLVVEREVAGGL